MTYDSFECELDFADRKYIGLEVKDGVVTVRNGKRGENLSDEEKATARHYAEYYMRRIGRPFKRCAF